MKKYFSLIKACLTEDMNLFKISTKKQNKITKIILPIFLVFILMGVMYSYSEGIIEILKPINMEYIILTLFIGVTSMMTLIEGIYKSGNLIFNCRDDNLLLSLPIKKSTVLFIRIFKFYIFEFIYNSIFLLPAIIVYGIHMKPGFTYYIISFIGILIFPIIPILLSCLIGAITSYFASNFKGKNLVQTFLSFIFLICIMYVSYNSNGVITNITQNANNINDFITKIYYPVKVYMDLVINFNSLKLLEFTAINIIPFIIFIILMGRFYFKINSKTKAIKTKKTAKSYIIKTSTPTISLIKKEFNRFINSSVFITNAAFGLVLFILVCILITIKFDSMVDFVVKSDIDITKDYIKSCMPVVLFGFICFTSFMTSITSSMISLEGKSFNILKSLPIKPHTIVIAKVLTAILIMLPCILVGNLIIFISFRFDILSIILILIASVLLPLISETIGIIVNLKYPRMDAKTDTEVVKQSISSAISVFIGMALTGITIILLVMAVNAKLNNNIIILIFTSLFAIIYAMLSWVLHKICDKSFNNISV